MKCLAQEHNTVFPARTRTRTGHEAPHIPEEKKNQLNLAVTTFSQTEMLNLMLLILIRLLAVCFSLEISAGIMRRLFGQKENRTRHGRGTHVSPSSPLGHTTLSRLLLYTANVICVRDDSTLVLVTLKEKTGCQQTKF